MWGFLFVMVTDLLKWCRWNYFSIQTWLELDKIKLGVWEIKMYFKKIKSLRTLASNFLLLTSFTSWDLLPELVNLFLPSSSCSSETTLSYYDLLFKEPVNRRQFTAVISKYDKIKMLIWIWIFNCVTEYPHSLSVCTERLVTQEKMFVNSKKLL